MADATAADQIAFEALPDEVQALARRVLEIDYEKAFDDGVGEGFNTGFEEGASSERAKARAATAAKVAL